jgi:two-component system response regulator HupR/HoxA
VRVIAATNRDLETEMREGARADLFYRLAGMIVRLPDLGDRPGDLPVLVESLLEQAMARMGKSVPGVAPEAMARLAAYDWPGNVRELQNEIQRMLVRGEEGRWLGLDVVSPHIHAPAMRPCPWQRTALSSWCRGRTATSGNGSAPWKRGSSARP